MALLQYQCSLPSLRQYPYNNVNAVLAKIWITLGEKELLAKVLVLVDITGNECLDGWIILQNHVRKQQQVVKEATQDIGSINGLVVGYNKNENKICRTPKDLMYCRACDLHICVQCYKLFHTKENLAQMKDELYEKYKRMKSDKK